MYHFCIQIQNFRIMETREYFEKVMQDYNQNRNGQNLRKYSILNLYDDGKYSVKAVLCARLKFRIFAPWI